MLEQEVKDWPKVWQCTVYPSLRQNESSNTTCHTGEIMQNKTFSLFIWASSYENEDVSDAVYTWGYLTG